MMDEEQRGVEDTFREAGENKSPTGANGQVPPTSEVPGPGDMPPESARAPGEADDLGAGAGAEASDADGDDTGPPRTGKKGKKPKKRGSFFRELPVLVVIALALALLIKTYAFQAYFIPSGSMQNTLEIGDKVLVNKIVYHLRSIHRGDIIVFNGAGSWNPGPTGPTPNPADRLYHAVIGLFGAAPGQTDYIKRVIGIPGDHVVCCNTQGDITVNGVALHESSYLYPGNVPSQSDFSTVVKPGMLWVMGDHRAVSDDSRDHTGYPGGGDIPQNEVVGRAFWIVWPPSRWRVLPIPSTFEQSALNHANSSAASAGGQRQADLDALSAPGVSVPITPSGSPLPLAAGLLGAIPLTWGQRRLRKRIWRKSRGRMLRSSLRQ
jgi:signal peptidase I